MIYILTSKRRDSGLEYRLYDGSELSFDFQSLSEDISYKLLKIRLYFDPSPVYDSFNDVKRVALERLRRKNAQENIVELSMFSNLSYEELT